MNHHIITSSTKVYLRFKEKYPETQLMSTAFEGFLELGAEVVPFYWIDDIDEMEDLGPDTFVCGYIGDVHRSLQKMGKSIPEPLDYPESLQEFLGRKIYKSTLGEVRHGVEKVFVKPVEQKLFTGFVFDGSWASRRRIVTIEDSTPVWVSECIEMDSEYRCIVLNGDIIDVRRYKGDWALAPLREVVERAVQCFELSGKAPACYTLDFAVNNIGTVLVEANDGFAFGHYGMSPVAYATCLAARLMQLASG
jgi:hypothetical protein